MLFKAQQLAYKSYVKATKTGALKEGDIPSIAKAALREAIMTPYSVPKYMKKSEALNIIRGMIQPE